MQITPELITAALLGFGGLITAIVTALTGARKSEVAALKAVVNELQASLKDEREERRKSEARYERQIEGLMAEVAKKEQRIKALEDELDAYRGQKPRNGGGGRTTGTLGA